MFKCKFYNSYEVNCFETMEDTFIFNVSILKKAELLDFIYTKKQVDFVNIFKQLVKENKIIEVRFLIAAILEVKFDIFLEAIIEDRRLGKKVKEVILPIAKGNYIRYFDIKGNLIEK